LKQHFFFIKKEKYESNIKEIFTILDTDKSDTINLQELKILYPDAAHTLFERFDTDENEELDVEELKELINSNQLATDILNQLQAQAIFFNFLIFFHFIITFTHIQMTVHKSASGNCFPRPN